MKDERYLVLLRREFVRSQARLKRAEQERDRFRERIRDLERLLREHGIEPPDPPRTD